MCFDISDGLILYLFVLVFIVIFIDDFIVNGH